MAFIYSAFADEIDPGVDIQIRELKRHDIRFVEFRSADGVNVLDIGDADLSDIAESFRREGIGISALGSPVGKIPVDAPYEDCMEQVRRGLKAARLMGADRLRVFSYYHPGRDAASCRDEVLRRMEGMARLAGQAGITLQMENELELYGEDAPSCLDVLESVGAPHLKLTFDPSNFVQCGQDVEQAYHLLQPWLTYVHVKDSVWGGAKGGATLGHRQAGDVHRPAGEGEGKLPWLAQALRGDGYDGFVSIEPHLTFVESVPGTGVEKFAAAAKAARRYF